MAMVVVLPAPLPPSSATVVPAATVKLTASTAVTRSNRLVRAWTSMTGALMRARTMAEAAPSGQPARGRPVAFAARGRKIGWHARYDAGHERDDFGGPHRLGGGRDAAAGACPRATARGRVRLRTLVLIRWVAVAGQAAALLIVHFGLGFKLPLGPALRRSWRFRRCSTSGTVALVAAAPRRALDDRAAAVFLAFDILQLAVLLYLTGGPAQSLRAPDPGAGDGLGHHPVARQHGGAAAARRLEHRPAGAGHLPLPWREPGFTQLSAVRLRLRHRARRRRLFTATYVMSIAEEARRMSDALSATQLALAREQRLSALGALAAAAAHELGTPLATIAVVAKELARELPADSPLREDVLLLLRQSRTLPRHPDAAARGRPARTDRTATRDAAGRADRGGRGAASRRPRRPHASRMGPRRTAASPPRARRSAAAASPEILHGLGNLVENAARFRPDEVRVASALGPERLALSGRRRRPRLRPPGSSSGSASPICSGGPQGRAGGRQGRGGMGLGFFIAKTLIERDGRER